MLVGKQVIANTGRAPNRMPVPFCEASVQGLVGSWPSIFCILLILKWTHTTQLANGRFEICTRVFWTPKSIWQTARPTGPSKQEAVSRKGLLAPSGLTQPGCVQRGSWRRLLSPCPQLHTQLSSGNMRTKAGHQVRSMGVGAGRGRILTLPAASSVRSPPSPGLQLPQIQEAPRSNILQANASWSYVRTRASEGAEVSEPSQCGSRPPRCPH